MQPVDFGSILRSGMSVVPDYANQMLKKQQMQIEQQQENRLTGVADREAAQNEAYNLKAAEVFRNPTPQSIAELQAMFPKQHEAIKAGWATMDKSRKDTDLQQTANIWNAAKNGRFDVASKLARQRYDADFKAGLTDEMDKLVVDILERGSDDEKATVAGLIGHQLLAEVGPEKFWSSYESLSEGQRREALLPSEIAKDKADLTIKQAEAESAPDYYAARARGEDAQADIRESDANWRDAFNRDRSNLSKARQQSVIAVAKRAAAYKGKPVGKVTAGDVVETIARKGEKGGLSQRDLDSWSTYRKADFKEGQTATNAAGQKIIFKGGRWVLQKKGG